MRRGEACARAERSVTGPGPGVEEGLRLPVSRGFPGPLRHAGGARSGQVLLEARDAAHV